MVAYCKLLNILDRLEATSSLLGGRVCQELLGSILEVESAEGLRRQADRSVELLLPFVEKVITQ